jgi:hypothetical protein
VPTLFAKCPFQFLVYYSVCLFCFVCGAWVSLFRGLCWFISGVAVGIPHATYLLMFWSASLKQVRSWHLVAWEPSWFLRISWYGLGVWGFRVLPLLGGFTCQVRLQSLSKIFTLWTSPYLLLPSSCHLVNFFS